MDRELDSEYAATLYRHRYREHGPATGKPHQVCNSALDQAIDHGTLVHDQENYSKQCPEGWKVVMQTCREENAQSFAGQHAKDSTSWYLFDEASEIPDPIWDVAFGGLTDG